MGLTSGILCLLGPTSELFFILSYVCSLIVWGQTFTSTEIQLEFGVTLGPMDSDCLFSYFLDGLLTQSPFVWVLCAENLRL